MREGLREQSSEHVALNIHFWHALLILQPASQVLYAWRRTAEGAQHRQKPSGEQGAHEGRVGTLRQLDDHGGLQRDLLLPAKLDEPNQVPAGTLLQ